MSARAASEAGRDAVAVLHGEHVARVCDAAASALESVAFEGIVFHAGSLALRHADDLEIPFRSTPHFARFAHVEGPEHFVVYRPGARPQLIRVKPASYWVDSAPPLEGFVGEAFEVSEVGDVAAAIAAIGSLPRHAFVGASRETAARLGIPDDACEPPSLMAALDWQRGTKTAYEIACIRAAIAIAADGHATLRSRLAERPSERALHYEYLAATRLLDEELPYPNIIAWDRHAAVLHHQQRSIDAPDPGASFLVDAGATYRGYACDITRSYRSSDARGATADVFSALLDGVDALQRRAVERVRPGLEYLDLHLAAREEIAQLLCEARVIRSSVEEALANGYVDLFFPHGLGHHLGLQVHDVGGRQIDPTGTQRPPPPGCENLRTTRPLEVDQVVTIEPGIYFIEMLLEPARASAALDAIDWQLVDALIPWGGIRVEDDVQVVEGGGEDLSRPRVPGHFEAMPR